MSFSYENQGTYTYLVYEIKPEDTLDSMSLGMITNNKIQGLAPSIFTQVDATKYIKYNVSAKISVKQFFEGQVNRKRLLGVFNGIVDAMMAAEDYMIDEQSIMLDLDYVFTDVSTCETVLICLPIQKEDAQPVNLGDFFKNIMFGTQFDQTENCDHIAKIMNYLNSTPMFSLVNFKELLKSLDGVGGAVAPSVSAAPQPVAPVVNKPQPVVKPTPVQPVAAPVAPQPVAPPPAAKPQPTPMSIPTPAPAPAPVQTSAPTEVSNEKKIGMFDLLMHYSKENAELYKAQKAAKKSATAPSTPSAKPQKPANTSFAVPGQGGNASFAIPGQAAPSAPAPVAVPKPVAAPAAKPAIPQPAVAQKPAAPVMPAPMPAPMPQPAAQSMNFGETTVLGGGNIGETTVLSAIANPQTAMPHLIRTKNNEKIPLNKPVFRVGKERSYVDYFVGDNTAISRSHANFISRDGAYFVVDTNSTNHTYVNGEMIQSNAETPIKQGDRIRLANEEFEFRML